MNIRKCFKKRTVLVSALVMMLTVMGYLNNQLTKSALRQSSKGYKEHQEMEMAKIKQEEKNQALETASKSVQVVEGKVEEKKDQSTNKAEEPKKVKEDNNYFVEHRLSRDKVRGESVDRLNKIVEDEKTNEETRSSAQSELMDLGETLETELLIEGLVKGKGFKDAVVFFNNDSARIIVDSEKLTEQDAMKILEIVTSETKLEPSDIKIMEKQ